MDLILEAQAETQWMLWLLEAAIIKLSLNEKLLSWKTLIYSFNEFISLYTVQIKPLRFPVIKIRSSVIDLTYSRTHVYSIVVTIQQEV